MIRFIFSAKSVWVVLMLSISIFLNAQITPTDGIVYVTPDGTGNGSSWLNPTGDLHNAIHTDGVQKVFVAVGNYDVGDNSFVMENGVEIYGGFDPANGITDLTHNRILPNHGVSEGSVLNGQDARPVIWNDGNGLNNTAIIDGFTVKNGFNSLSNGGAGIYNNSTSPTFRNLVIKDNWAETYGGGMCNVASSPTIISCVFTGNRAGVGGGMYYRTASSPTMINCVVEKNKSASGNGGGIYNWSDYTGTFINVTVANNMGGSGGTYTGVFNVFNAEPSQWKNSIIWDVVSDNNHVASNSLIQGHTSTDDGNLDATGIAVTDIFTDPSNGDYTLKSGSPVINGGSNISYTGLNANTKDLGGAQRLSGDAIDMGAYEFLMPTHDENGIIYVMPNGTGNGNSWENATNDLHNAIQLNGVTKVFVAVGNYNVGDYSFVMKNGVEIYGGFDPDNNIKTLEDNRIMPNPANIAQGSVLNGQGARPVIRNVFDAATAMDNTAILDGFSVYNGSSSDGGGGIRNVYASPTLRNLVIRNNNATIYGAGIFNNLYSSPVISNTVISGNSVTNVINNIFGAGVYNNNYSNPVLTNTTITGNKLVSTGSGDMYGAGIYNGGGSVVQVYNSIIWNNQKNNDATASGADVQNIDASLILKNSITQSYNTGNTADNNLINVNPLFVSASDFTLHSASPAVNAGSNTWFTGLSGATKDLAGNLRLYDSTIDMGAFEFNLLPDSDGVIYVRQTTTGTGSGANWENATADLQGAIDATNVQKVYVATGNYNVGSASFIMKNGVEIYGGFNPVGNTTDWGTRTLANKGMGDGSVLNGQNMRPLIWNNDNGLDNTALLDGFTLTNGKGNLTGAIYNFNVAPTYNNLVIRNNEGTTSGGAMYNANAPIILTNSIIKDNTAGYGGAIRNNGSDAVLTNVSITGNSATLNDPGAGGGGIFNEDSAIELKNVLIANNSSVTGGGGFRNLSGNPVFTNVNIVNNTATSTSSEAMDIVAGTPQINNSIVYGTTSGTYTPQYSLIQGNTDFTNGNIDITNYSLADIFTDYANGDYILKENSPAVDTGNNTLFSGLDETTKDLTGNPRVDGSAIDMGAYEYSHLSPDVNGIIYVKETAVGNRSGSDWGNATADLHNAIHTVGVQKVFVAVGNYNVGEHSFIMKNGVEIYGGFDPANGITDLTHTRILPNKTASEGSVLNGQNTRPVIWNQFNSQTELNNTAVIDGFTIKNGYNPNEGGGISNSISSAVYRNLVIKNNTAKMGGGIYIYGRSPVFIDVVIQNNTASQYGGGVFSTGSSSAQITNAVIKGNTSTYTGAGFINNNYSSPVLTNVLITGNLATSYDDANGAFNSSGNVTLRNVTIAGNITNGYGHNIALQTNGGTFTVYNSIIFGTRSGWNMNFKQSFVEGNSDTSNGNIDATGIAITDVFTNPSEGDYTLKNESPAVDAGEEDLYEELDETTKDLAGNARVYQFSEGGVLDLGAYESSHMAFPYITLTPDANGIIYVKETASGSKNGSNWNNATDNLKKAIRATGVQQVWAATGTYFAKNIKMENNVAVYGGFDPDNGIDDLTDDRILPNPGTGIEGSIIDGQNSATVIVNDNNGLDNTAVLDGFTITNGKGNSGGGFYNNGASPTLRNLWIKSNTATSDGGGMYNINSSSPVMTGVTISSNTAVYAAGMMNRNSSSPVMTNVSVKSNTAGSDGGGMYNDVSASPVMANVFITGNTAQNGAGMYNRTNSSPVITNALIIDNTATANGAAICNESSSSPSLTNVTIAVNSGSNTLYATDGSATLANSIVFGTVAGGYSPQYSLIEGNTNFNNGNLNPSGIGMEDVFINPSANDFTLKENSPAINSGNNNLFPDLDESTLDLAGNSRVYNYSNGGSIDMGAYESAYNITLAPDQNGIIYVKETDAGTGSGNSWENATGNLHGAIDTDNVQKVFVAVGHYTTGGNSFVMKDGVEIYGGFDPANGITDLGDNRILPSLTEEGSVLDGEDSRTVIRNEFTVENPLDNTAVLDGFTITEGNGYAGGNYGGGIYNYYASPVLTNLVIKNGIAYQGGGIYNEHSDPIVTNTIIHNNEAYGGGGVCNIESSPVFTNITISENTASGSGGAIYMDESSGEVVFTNAKITGNTGESSVIYSFSIESESDITFINAEITDNQITQPFYSNSALVNNSSSGMMLFQNMTFASNGNGTKFRNTAGGISLKNSIAFGVYEEEYQFTAEYSFIEDNEDDSNGNIVLDIIYEDEIFTDPDDGDFTLKINSPVINAGNNALYPGLDENTLDLAGNQRLFGENIDLGAYESTFVPASEHCLYATTWNGASWSNGEPDYDTQAIIDGELELDYELDACEVVVTPNGSLRILADGVVDCDWSVTNLATAEDFVIENNGVLIQWEEVENTGAITVKRNSSSMIRLDYTLWSSPVVGQNLFNFSPETVNGVTNYPGSPGRIYVYNGNSGYINPTPFNENAVMNSGTGYLYRSPNNFDSTVPAVYEGIFTGVPFNGDLSVPTVANNYTSIGNPYPSNIEAGVLFYSNPGLNTLYFWVNTPIEDGEYVGNNYATYNLAGGVSNTGEVSGEGVPSEIISAGQGFIVSTTDNSVAFNNFMRTDETTDFFKPSEFERHRFWLNLSDENNIGLNQILIAYMENATLGFDTQIDGELFGYEGSAIYSLIDDASTGSATKFTIQGRSLPFEDSDVVPLGFKAVESGKFKIELANFDGLFAEGQKIYLKDKKLDLIQDLEIPYEFESEAGTFDNRFEIIYKNDETMGIDDLTVNGILIYKNQNFIEVSSELSLIDSVEIFDLSGRKLFSEPRINASTFQIDSKQFGTQVLVVKVKTQNGVLTNKKVVNN